METIETVSIEQTDAEIRQTLGELRDYEKKNLKMNRIKMICVIAIAVIALFTALLLLINVGSVVGKIETLSQSVTETSESINAVAKDLNKVDLQKLGASLQTIADDGEDTILAIGKVAGNMDSLMKSAEDALAKINSIDIQELNDGIKTLGEVLEPLAKFFKVFN